VTDVLLASPHPAPHVSLLSSNDVDAVVVPSVLLGAVEVPRSELFTLPVGIFGFEHCRTFALVPSGREGLWWLQSTEREALVFLLADPFRFFPGYEVSVGPADLAHLGADERTTLMALAVVTLPRTVEEAPSANLRAPVLLDVQRRVGRQVVLADERYAVRTPIALD